MLAAVAPNGAWQDSWWGDRLVLDPAGGSLVAEFALEDPEVIEICSEEELDELRRRTGDDWVLRSRVEAGGALLPAGARLLQLASLTAAPRPGPLPQLALPAAVAFERTPAMQTQPREFPRHALAKGGALYRRLKETGGLGLLRFDVSGQRLGSAFVVELCRCLADCGHSPAHLALGANELDDGAGRALAHYLSTQHSGQLRRVVLERNGLTKHGAWELVKAVAAVSQRMQNHACERVFLDLAFNAIWDPKRLLEEAEYEFPGTHGPGGDCGVEWCARDPGQYLLHLNVGPAWRSDEAMQCAQNDRRWRFFMHGPAVELQRVLEWAGGRDLDTYRWECPLDGKRVVPLEGKKRCPEVTFGSILSSHIEGSTHRKKVAAGESAANPERSSPFVLEFPIRNKNWVYYFNACTGAQGWNEEDTQWEPDACDFMRPEWWEETPLHLGGEWPAGLVPAGLGPGSGEGIGSCNREARAILTGYRFGQFYGGLPEGEREHIYLKDEEIVTLNLPESSGAPIGFRSGTFTFHWRSFLATRSFTADWPPARSMAVERHASALDFNDERMVYLVVDFEGHDVRALLKPFNRPLFEDKHGFLVSIGSWPRATAAAPAAAAAAAAPSPRAALQRPAIFATRAAEVYDAFKATHERRVRRLRLPATGEAGRHRSFNEDVEDFLMQVKGFDKADIWDSDQDCSKVHKAIGHRVRLDSETHRWIADPDLDLGLWEFLRQRRPAAPLSSITGASPGGSPMASPDELLATRHLALALARLRQAFADGIEEPIVRCAADDARERLRLAPHCRQDVGDRLASALDGLLSPQRCRGSGGVASWFLGELRSALGEYAAARTIEVPVGECRFTQPSISEVFAGGRHQGHPLDKTIEELRERPDLRRECPELTLEGAYYKGKVRIINNRRLYCFQKALRPEERIRVRLFPLIDDDDDPELKTRERRNFMWKFLDAMREISGDGEAVTVRRRPRLGDRAAADGSPGPRGRQSPSPSRRRRSPSPLRQRPRSPSPPPALRPAAGTAQAAAEQRPAPRPPPPPCGPPPPAQQQRRSTPAAPGSAVSSVAGPRDASAAAATPPTGILASAGLAAGGPAAAASDGTAEASPARPAAAAPVRQPALPEEGFAAGHYDAVEVGPDGKPEWGYLRLTFAQQLVRLSGLEPGHANNRHFNYCFGMHSGGSGWFPAGLFLPKAACCQPAVGAAAGTVAIAMVPAALAVGAAETAEYT